MTDPGAIPTPAVLELREITKSYRSPDGGSTGQLFRPVSLSLGAGEISIIAGRSGSGKTTILNIAAGLTRPSEGVVCWNGQPLASFSDKDIATFRRDTLGIIFQDAALVSTLTAAENVALVSYVNRGQRDARRRAATLLERVGLAHRGSHLPHQLSGGERQRVAIARALFNEPTLILVDEPTASLDAKRAAEIVEILIGLAAEGRSLLVASHDANVVKIGTTTFQLEDSVSGRT